jgi:hypothetical protein
VLYKNVGIPFENSRSEITRTLFIAISIFISQPEIDYLDLDRKEIPEFRSLYLPQGYCQLKGESGRLWDEKQATTLSWILISSTNHQPRSMALPSCAAGKL